MSEETYDLIVVGGGNGGSAAVLRAAQYYLRAAWVQGDARTAKASRGRYVRNVDNMIGVHSDIVVGKVLERLAGEEHAAARRALEGEHFHIGSTDIIENVVERVEGDYAEQVVRFEERAVGARREGDGFAVTTASGAVLVGGALVLSTGVMDRQPSVAKELSGGRVLDDIRWIFPWANHERLLYCIRCEGHLTAGTPTAVIGSGESAAQLALMLHERYGSRVAILANGEPVDVRGPTLRLLGAFGISIHTERIVDVVDRPAGADTAARQGKKGDDLHAFALAGGERVEARFGLVALGLHRVQNDLARELGAELEESDEPDERRHVLVEDRTAETSVRGLFCVGDMARRTDGGPSMKQVYTAQEYAVRAVDTIDRRQRSAHRQALLRG